MINQASRQATTGSAAWLAEYRTAGNSNGWVRDAERLAPLHEYVGHHPAALDWWRLGRWNLRRPQPLHQLETPPG
jgi:hypothetical protein